MIIPQEHIHSEDELLEWCRKWLISQSELEALLLLRTPLSNKNPR